MSAPGIQLGSAGRLTFFEPSVRQYLQQVEQAVVSQNLTAAQQAFAQLEQRVRALTPSTVRTSASQFPVRSVGELGNVGAALESGDLSAAGRALAELREKISEPIYVQSDGEVSLDQATPSNPTGTEARDQTGGPDASQNLNLTA